MIDLFPHWKTRHRALGDHPCVYSARRHWRQWWGGLEGRRLRRLPWRHPIPFASIAPLLFLLHLSATPTPAWVVDQARASVWTAPAAAALPTVDLLVQFETRTVRRAREKRPKLLEANSTIVGPRGGRVVGALTGGVVIILEVLEAGFRYAALPATYEALRPTLPAAANGTLYVDSEAAGGGNGTSGTPYNELSDLDAVNVTGKLVLLQGTFTNQSIRPATSGTSTNWIAYKVRPGFECTITGRTDGYDAVWLSQSAKEYVWIEGLDLDTYAGTANVWSVAHANSTQRGPVVVMDCTCIGGVQVKNATDSWIEGGTVRKWGGRALPHGPTTAITVALAGAGAGNVDAGAHRYRVRFKVPYSDALVTSTTDHSPVGQYFEGSSTTATYADTTSASVTTTGGNGQVDLSNIPVSAHTDCTEKEIYRLITGGTSTTVASWKLLATISNATTTYRDNISDANLGAALTNLQGNQGTGISILDSSHRTIVYDVTVGECGHGGIEVAFSGSYTGDRSADVRIALCTVDQPWAGGVATAQSDDAIVEGCLIKNTAQIMADGARHVGTPQGLILSGYRTIGRYNRVTNTWGQAIVIQSQQTSQDLTGNGIKLLFNAATGCYGAGFMLYASGDLPCENIEVRNNIFWNNCQGGEIEEYETYGYFNGVLYEMWVYSSLLSGSALTAWYPSGVSTLGPGNVIASNFIGTSSGAMVHVRPAGQGGTQANTLAEAASRYGSQFANQTYADPLFLSTDPTNPNFCAIQNGSPAKNAGVAVTGYNYRGSAPDIGVYEVN